MSLCLYFSIHCDLVNITNNILTTESNGCFSGFFIHDFSVAFGTDGIPLFIYVFYTFISFGFWDRLPACVGSSSSSVSSKCPVGGHLGGVSPGCLVSLQIIPSLAYALPCFTWHPDMDELKVKLSSQVFLLSSILASPAIHLRFYKT